MPAASQDVRCQEIFKLVQPESPKVEKSTSHRNLRSDIQTLRFLVLDEKMEILRSTAENIPALPLSNPFFIHALIETFAVVSFLTNPSGQIGVYTPHAHAVIRQYGVLLLSSVLVSLIFANRDPDGLSGQVAGALAVYHVAPILRAMSRLFGEEAVWQPLLFLAGHGLCLAGLIRVFWELYVVKVLLA